MAMQTPGLFEEMCYQSTSDWSPTPLHGLAQPWVQTGRAEHTRLVTLGCVRDVLAAVSLASPGR